MQDAPDPALIFDTLNAHQRSAALRGAIELDLFTTIARGHRVSATIAEGCGANQRAVRILCDFLVVNGFLTKEGNEYGLTPTAALFLDRESPNYMGTIARFVNSADLLDAFRDVAELVRRGTTTMEGDGAIEPDWDGWVEFARSMVPMMAPTAKFIGAMAAERWSGPIRVLDVAAGHGLFGISIAQENPDAKIVALDWEKVLEVATENAERAGLRDRYELLPGDALKIDYGTEYDVVLLTNILHHFDKPTCLSIMEKVRDCLSASGVVLTLEFIPDEDRVSPPVSATFAFMMLGTTPAGDAYTFSEYEQMWQRAGLHNHELIEIDNSAQRLILSLR